METTYTNIKYKYAFDEKQNLVCIDNVTKEDRELHTYKCISCGKELIARLGEKRVKHFAHKSSEEDCSNESYLHILGKQLIMQKFYKDEPFLISFKRFCYCHHKSDCTGFEKETCKADYLYEFNLKDKYKYIGTEKKIDNFVADVLFESDDKSYPAILFEIFCSHECTEEKKNSGLHIIEIKVTTEEELVNIISGEITESGHVVFHGFQPNAKDYLYKQIQGKILTLFNQSNLFSIPLNKKLICSNYDKCLFFKSQECTSTITNSICITDLYNQAEVDAECNGEQYALKLSNNKDNIPPVYFDLCFSSQCNRKHSNNGERIIRINSCSLNNFEKILSQPAIKKDTDVSFENFNNIDNPEPSESIKRYDIITFTLFKSNKAFINWKPGVDFTCKSLQRTYKPSAIFQVAFEENESINQAYTMGYALARVSGIQFQSCYLCQHKRDFPIKTEDKGILCNKHIETKQKLSLDHNCAKSCPYYDEKPIINKFQEKIKNIRYIRLL